ncbi:NUDIX hydrolase domain-like protein [Radiomyces spectabilis]|uniref:NUDIX hydrolase domain-like protein n=1 Tax=Radiomyces spectabilis TaxID=64574 RepID=UPI00221F07EC|nr:NUDIX hydrolase domain-like protein [Radiomyces spectabilis]KAI8379073.1 NUDIX hydrolase domain-like protein [Radiomyces spectabilis]
MTIQGKKFYTLVFTLDQPNQKILLGMKKRGFGMNKYNGFGGKLEPGETIEEAAYRELLEESYIKAKDMKHVGINLFTFENNPIAMEVHVFVTLNYEGTPLETEEMRPEWFSYDAIPYDQMWTDDRFWLPIALDGKMFIGEYYFAEDQKTILSEKLDIVHELPREFDLDKRTF